MQPTPDSTKARRILAANDCGQPVGYRYVKTYPTPDRWEAAGYELIGTTGMVTVRLDMIAYHVGVIHPF